MPGLGTTNVDYSLALYEHFQTLRTYRNAGKKAGASITYVEIPGGNHVNVAAPQIVYHQSCRQCFRRCRGLPISMYMQPRVLAGARCRTNQRKRCTSRPPAIEVVARRSKNFVCGRHFAGGFR